jgi:hypothetical protein
LATISGPLSDRWDPFVEHGVRQRLNDADGVDPASDPDRQALAGELIDQGHQPNTPAIMGRGLDKVEAPDVVGPFRSKPDTGSVIELKTRPLRLFLRYFQPLTPPNALNPVLAHYHATVVEHGRHPAVAVTAIVRCNQDNVPGQFILVGLQRRNVSLRPTWLPDNPAGVAFAQVIVILRCINSLPAPLGA